MRALAAILLTFCSTGLLFGQTWPQGPGPQLDFSYGESAAPSAWSVTRSQNMAWRVKLPETGQSSPIVWGDRIFLTTMKPVEEESKTGKDIVAWCFSTRDGSVLWKREIEGGYPTKLSGPFGDASSPAPVTDGKSVWVLNPTGRLCCFDLQGRLKWSKSATSVARSRPVLFNGMLILHRQTYHPNEAGTFTHDNGKLPQGKWTQLRAWNASTGEPIWTSECGVNMGCVPLVQRLGDGTAVMVVGRGGGHNPPEKPEGVSLIRAEDGVTLWTLELPGFMSTQTYPIVDDQALIFHKGEHLWVDAKSGRITKRVSIVRDVTVRRRLPTGRMTVKEALPARKPRSITQQSNLRVGDYHYFRSYTKNYLGRVQISTGKVAYLELPLQVQRNSKDDKDVVLWPKPPAPQAPEVEAETETRKQRRKKQVDPIAAAITPNRVVNSRGIQVMGDGRAVRNGWGHTASPLPTAFGNRLFVPLLSGIVFVIQADSNELNEDAVLAINDLGPLGDAFTRGSITTDGTRAYAHTIQELIAIQTDVNTE